MNLDRRDFLHATLGSAALVAAARASAAETKASALPAFDERAPEAFWAGVRNQFPLTRQLAYFNTGGLGPASAPALAKAAETVARLQERSEHGHGLLAGAREVAARFLGGAAEEIAFVRNATEGNAIVAAGIALAPGDEIVFETHAHPGGSFAWLNQQKLRGAVVKVFEPDARSVAGNLARLEAVLTPRTRVVQVSHVTAPTGILFPVTQIARLCRERGIWFHVDGAQSAGMLPFGVREIGCDSFATSGHKWLGAPHETGLLWIRREHMDEIAPTLVGAYSGDVEMLPGELKLAPNSLRYEYGTRNAAAIVALAEALRFQEAIGRERIAARGRELVARVRTGLAKLPGVEILTPDAPELCASMLAFRSGKVPQDKLFGRLLSEHKIRARPVTEQKLNALRVSTHIFNSPAECDALVEGVAQILKTA